MLTQKNIYTKGRWRSVTAFLLLFTLHLLVACSSNASAFSNPVNKITPSINEGAISSTVSPTYSWLLKGEMGVKTSSPTDQKPPSLYVFSLKLDEIDKFGFLSPLLIRQATSRSSLRYCLRISADRINPVTTDIILPRLATVVMLN